jgi:two-component system KDP operon response regulator KdpE
MDESGCAILVVDDETPIRRFLHTSLAAYGYTIEEAATGAEALERAVSNPPDLIILDLGLPDMDGIEVIRRLREWTQVALIVVTVRDREEDKITALDAGADDYLTKPFGLGELMARLRVALRRSSQAASDPIFRVGDLVVDLSKRVVTVRTQEIDLTPTEYDLLRCMVVNSGKVMTHGQLLRNVWGPAYEKEMHLLRVNMSNLRRKIEEDPTHPVYLLTDPGVGYRLKVEL